MVTKNGREIVIRQVDAARRRLLSSVRELLDKGVDAIYAYCEEGPEIYLHLEQLGVLLPRDLQLVALCTSECELNTRLGVTHVCLHPELAPEMVFQTLVADSPVEQRTIELPFELIRGSTTR